MTRSGGDRGGLFAISFAIYALTLGWLTSLVTRPRPRRVAWWVATVLAVAAAFEMIAIVGQMVRGRQSHFNVATPFDAAVFAAMGALVGVLFLATVVVAVVLVATAMADRATAWAVRLGLVISLAGMSVGFLMLAPTPEQSAQGSTASTSGAHGVGVVDGGPGLPLLGWSTTGGDLRVAHFVGMHALQVLPLLALLLISNTRMAARTRLRVVVTAGVAYSGIAALTLWQALRGQPLLAPDPLTTTTLAALFIAVVATWIATGRARSRPELANTPQPGTLDEPGDRHVPTEAVPRRI